MPESAPSFNSSGQISPWQLVPASSLIQELTVSANRGDVWASCHGKVCP